MDPNLKDRITSALADPGAEFADIRLELLDNSRISYRGGRLEAVTMSRDVGGSVRVLSGGRWE